MPKKPDILTSMDYTPSSSPLYKLLLAGRRSFHRKGQVIGTFDSEPAIYLIVEGYVERYLTTKDGSKGIQVVYGPTEFLPLTRVYKEIFHMNIYRGPETYYYQAMTDINICATSVDALKTALAADPTMYKDLFYAAGVRLNSYIQRLENMSLRVANRKIAYQLIYLATKFGEKSPAGMIILMPLSHQILADILNLARETVTRNIARLEQKHLISVSGRQIVVLDLEKLKAEVR